MTGPANVCRGRSYKRSHSAIQPAQHDDDDDDDDKIRLENLKVGMNECSRDQGTLPHNA